MLEDFYRTPYGNAPAGRTFPTQYPTPQTSNFAPTQNFQPQIPQFRTNKCFVTSLEDALNRYAEPNTINVFHDQNEKFEYEITTDLQGRKTYKVIVLSDYTPVQEEKPGCRCDGHAEKFDAIESRLNALESILATKKEGKIKNEKSNDQ